MSCYECKWGPTPCKKWNVEGHTLLCQESKDYSIDYSWNEKMYQEYLESNILWEKTMNDTLEEIKNTFEDDTTEV